MPLDYSDNRTTNICLVAGRLGQNLGLQALHGVRVSVSLLAVAANCLLLLALIRHKALHFNLRLQLISLSVFLCLQRLFAVCWSLEFLIDAALFAVQNPCKMVMSTLACWLRRFPSTLLNYSILLSMLAIAIERGYATIKFKTYEKVESSTFGVALVILQVTPKTINE